MATAAAPRTEFRRAGQYGNGIGSNLDALTGKDVLVISYTVSKRRVFDQRQDATVERDFVLLTIAPDPSKPDQVSEYHAWSPALGERLSAIPTTDLPVLAKFSRVKTANGFSTWVVE